MTEHHARTQAAHIAAARAAIRGTTTTKEKP